MSSVAVWYGDAAPFTLALAGYAVVAPDYAGLGVSRTWDNSSSPIPHEYLASPAGGQDALYALRAAREAFEGKLSEDFVVMGHSQGGGVAVSGYSLSLPSPYTFLMLFAQLPGFWVGIPCLSYLLGPKCQ